jgi:hypothetical protein
VNSKVGKVKLEEVVRNCEKWARNAQREEEEEDEIREQIPKHAWRRDGMEDGQTVGSNVARG